MNEFLHFLYQFLNWFMAETPDPWEPTKMLCSPAEVCALMLAATAIGATLAYALYWRSERKYQAEQAARRINQPISE